MADGFLTILPLRGIGDVAAGDDLAAILTNAMEAAGGAPVAGDVLVVAQKIVSKAEGRVVRLGEVEPSQRAHELAEITGKDPRLVELVLAEAIEVVRASPQVLVVRQRLGLVMANAGIDRSNVGGADDAALLLPVDPDASAHRLRDALRIRFSIAPAVIISDSFGRPWRLGTVNVAIGVAGFPALVDRRGHADRYGRTLEATEIALADAVAAAAGLAMGEGAEGTPAALVRGVAQDAPDRAAAALVRPVAQDLFR